MGEWMSEYIKLYIKSNTSQYSNSWLWKDLNINKIFGVNIYKPRHYMPDNSIKTENTWQVGTGFYITWDRIHL